MKYKTAKLTPDLAKVWLGSMPEYQRKPSAYTVAEYASDMESGRWVEGTGDAFRFDKQGQMIDGQHRCLAVIDSGVTITVTVIEDLDNEVYMVIDRGRKRNAGDAIKDKTNQNVRAAIAKALISLGNGTTATQVVGGNLSRKKNPISATEVAEFANEHEELVTRILHIYNNFKAANNGRVSTSVCVGLISAICEQTGTMESAEKFMEDLVKPVDERPVICTMAREKAASFTITKGKNKNIPMFAIYLVAFKHWASGTTPKIIQTSAITKDVNAVPMRRNWV